jgi:xanthine dehydrogenase accessory factor
MNSIDIDVIRTALDWLDRGHRVVMGTVVRTWGSAPRPPGSLMIIRDDGQVAGSVSGGCIEDDLIGRVARFELAMKLPEVTTYGQTAEEVRRFGLPCGGTVQIVLEPLSPQSQLRQLLAEIQSHRRVQRRLDTTTGLVRHLPANEGDRVVFDGATLTTVHGPRLRLLIIGGGQLSRYLATMAGMLDYQVTICEPRVEYHEGWDMVPGVTLSTTMPDDLVLMEALRTPAFYVGALGSLQNNARRRERLLEFDVSPEEASRMHGPVGLNLGALTPPEIAMSIVAEMTALRRGTDLSGPLSNWAGSKTVCKTC